MSASLRSGPPEPIEADLDTVRYGLPLVRSRTGASPRSGGEPAEALVRSVIDLLDDGPVHVELSGGCDSSLVLAAAVRACAAADHDPPIAVTYRYASCAAADESAWQRRVLHHLGVRQWHVVDVPEGASDVLGPTARAALLAHGLVYPATTWARTAAVAHVGAGLLLSGEGGDEVLGERRVTDLLLAARAVRHGERPGAERVRRGARALLPARLRRPAVLRSLHEQFRPLWLEPDRAERVIAHLADEALAAPLRPSRFVGYHLGTVRLAVGLHNVRASVAPFGVRWEAPLLGERFAGALAAVPWHRFTGRNDLLHRYFGDWLPEELVWRRSKARFHEAYFGPHTRAFATAWDGEGVPDGVRADWLREHWRTAPMIFSSTGLLLQHVWLASCRGAGTVAGASRAADTVGARVAGGRPS